MEQKQDWYSSLIAIARKRGFSDGWAAHSYRDKTGVWPNKLHKRPLPVPRAEVVSYVKSRDIARAKAKAAVK